MGKQKKEGVHMGRPSQQINFDSSKLKDNPPSPPEGEQVAYNKLIMIK